MKSANMMRNDFLEAFLCQEFKDDKEWGWAYSVSFGQLSVILQSPNYDGAVNVVFSTADPLDIYVDSPSGPLPLEEVLFICNFCKAFRIEEAFCELTELGQEMGEYK